MREGRRSRRALVPLSLAVLLLFVACQGAASPSPSNTSTQTSVTRPSSTAVLSIVAPTNGQVIHGSTVELKVDLTGATLVQVTSTDLKQDQGHLHVILDDTLIAMTSGLKTRIPNVAAGRHLIKVEFVANDHAPFDPRVIVGVAFTVKA